MAKVALVDKQPSRIDYSKFFNFDFDLYHLCSDPKVSKILRSNADIDINVDKYDNIILVGSEATKHFTKVSVTAHSGKRTEGKYIPLINPAMLKMKPAVQSTWDDSVYNIHAYVEGKLKEVSIDEKVAFGIQDTQEANEFIKQAIKHPNPYIALDSETTGLYPRDGYMLGISISYNGKCGAYIDTDCFDDTTEQLLQQLFNKKTVVFHNAKFDMAFFEYHFHFKFPNFEDTMLLHYLVDENPGGHGLKELAIKHTSYGDYEKPMYEWIDRYRREHGILKDQFTWESIPFDVMKTYAAMDALVTFLLYEKLCVVKTNPKLKKVYENILIPGTRFLIDVQDNGVPFDRQRLYISSDAMQKDIDAAIETLYKNDAIQLWEKYNGKSFNPNSTVQLRGLLFDHLGLKPTGKKTGTGEHSTDAEVLKELATESEVPELILDIRQKSKIKNTYLDKIIPQLDRDSHLRTGFNLHGTTSGRLSSSGKLNMQQLPRDNPTVKGCIKAPEGSKIVAMDLTTAEVYVAAVLAKDKALMDVFRSGGNFHSTIAHKVFRLNCELEDVAEYYPDRRQAAKAVTFGIMYGAGPKKISEQITKDSGKYFSINEAKEVIDEYFGTFHKLKSWLDASKKVIEKEGKIYSYFGRRRKLPNVKSENDGIRYHSVRSGLNFLVQSAASDINLIGAIEMGEFIKTQNMKSKIFALVHDSILAEVPDDEVDFYCEMLQKIIQKDRGVSIPGAPIGCDFEIGEDYSMGKWEKLYDGYNV